MKQTDPRREIILQELRKGGKPVEIARRHQTTEAFVLRMRDQLRQAQKADKSRAAAMAAILGRINRLRDDEDLVTLVIRILDYEGTLEAKLGHGPIISIHYEYCLEDARIDVLVRHLGGIVSLIEAKGSGSLVKSAHGIGQALLYAELFRMNPPDWLDFAKVVPMLAIPTPKGRNAVALQMACERAGVQLFVIGSAESYLSHVPGLNRG